MDDPGAAAVAVAGEFAVVGGAAAMPSVTASDDEGNSQPANAAKQTQVDRAIFIDGPVDAEQGAAHRRPCLFNNAVHRAAAHPPSLPHDSKMRRSRLVIHLLI
jgi:hypothetical protein